MTSKATSLSNSQLKLAGYTRVTPIVPLGDAETVREIWASPDVYALLKGSKNPEAGFPVGAVERLFIGRYCKGLIVSCGREERTKCEFKWLKHHDQVWVLAFRAPRPGWRVFGRFARKNVFVAMIYHDRHDMADMVNYNALAKAIPTSWENTFPGVEPFKGGTFEDYLGIMAHGIDK